MQRLSNGTYIGTPAEMMELERLQKEDNRLKLPNPQWPYPSPYEMQADWLVRYPQTLNPYQPTKTTTGDAQWMEHKPKLMSHLEWAGSKETATLTVNC